MKPTNKEKTTGNSNKPGLRNKTFKFKISISKPILKAFGLASTNKTKRAEFLVLSEWYLNAGRVIILLIFLHMPGTIVERLIYIFILTGFGTLIHAKLKE